MDDHSSPAYPQARVTVVTLPDEIDVTNSSHAGASLAAALEPGTSVVIADLTHTRFCDSSGIRELGVAQQKALAAGAELLLAAPSPAVLRVIELTGLNHTVTTYPTLGQALTACQDGHHPKPRTAPMRPAS